MVKKSAARSSRNARHFFRAGNARPYDVYFDAAKNRRCGPMSTRKEQAASVTLLRREQLHKIVRPYKALQMEF